MMISDGASPGMSVSARETAISPPDGVPPQIE